MAKCQCSIAFPTEFLREKVAMKCDVVVQCLMYGTYQIMSWKGCAQHGVQVFVHYWITIMLIFWAILDFIDSGLKLGQARIYLSNGQWPLHVKIFVQKYLNYCPAKIFAVIFKSSHTSHWPSKVVEQIFEMAVKSANSENFLSVLMMYETATIYISSW